MSRGVPPAPLNLRDSSESSHSRQDSFSSYSSDKDKETPTSGVFDASPKSSYGQSTPKRKFSSSSSKPHSPTVNVYTHCGRHTDQYLFGGWSNVVKSFKRH